MPRGRVILKQDRFELTLRRLSQQLVENHTDFESSCIIGLQPRGIALADRIISILLRRHKLKEIEYGKLDITFYRDDYRRRDTPIAASETEMDFLVEGKRVILIDDVLYTGRTIQAALAALQDYGRPRSVELMTLIDRRFNRHLPIHADYIGLVVDSLDEAYVKVCWEGPDPRDEVILYPPTSHQKAS